METYNITKSKHELIQINGNIYWGSEKTLEGWEPVIGNFYILDARSNFRRYILHRQQRSLQEIISDLQKLADKYDLRCSGLTQTKNSFYPSRKFSQIFFIKGGKNTIVSDLKTIQRTTEENLQEKGSIALALGEKIPYKKNNSCAIDINEIIKPIHKDLIQSLDNLLSPKTP